MKLANFFLPHPTTHKKAHLISWEALVIYILLFVLLQVGFAIVGNIKPGVLGINSSIDKEKIIELTNKERQENGLEPVKENTALDRAAQLKAADMFAENYWAHFAPSGKTPWDFILGAGYKFTYAGENLAKNFYNSDDVVSAWMASPTHKENLLNSKYADIGIAVVDGVLNGQKTTLVVQMFGTTQNIAPAPIVQVQGKQLNITKQDYESAPQLVASIQSKKIEKPLLDPYQISKILGLGVILMIGSLLILDYIILRRRGIFRLASHHIAHLALLTLSGSALIGFHVGSIL